MPMEKNFDATEAEARIYAGWEAAGAFKAGANAKPGAPAFSIVIPPPNVTGSLHMGHAFNNTLQDILVRWHRMRGDNVLWQPGTDHAGIATQMVVERELALSQQPGRRALGRETFLEKVWEQKVRSEATILGQLKRLGASCDWSRTAFTMDEHFQQAVLKVFVEMYNKGLIYRGKRLVNWDPHFETAISDLEVESTEVDGHMWHFKYPLAGGESYEYVEKDAEGNVTLREMRDYISIATTRPETMLGDGAVAVHPLDERYKTIVRKLCEIPVGPKDQRRLIPIITDEYPDPLFGSGAVKITGAHDFNDYAVAKRNYIPLYPLMDTKGNMRSDEAADNMVPQRYRGLHRFRKDGVDGAREAVVRDITAEGLAVMVPNPRRVGDNPPPDEPELIPLVEAKKIMQPFGDRSKVVIEPKWTDQWFVDAAKIVQPAIDAVRDGRTTILPEQHEKVYFHWLENIEPWCISRQLWWGHQIPVWYGLLLLPDSNVREFSTLASFCEPNEASAIDLAEEYYERIGAKVRIVVDLDAVKQSMADFQAGRTDFVGIHRDPDVLDTWFSSGLWPIGTLGWPEQTPELKTYFPTSVLVTGFDIIFFWVARMMMMQLAVVAQVPFKTVYVHALVRDEKGKKMSKSLGNVLDPLDLIDAYGTDAVRFTLTAMAAMGRDLKLSKERIAGYRNFATKLWNATRFAEMNGVFSLEIKALDPKALPPDMHTVNRWIVGEVARARIAVDGALEAFRFDAAANALYEFVWGKVCDWYVEFSKPLMDGDKAAETRATMRWVLEQCDILLHPIMPFITEELWALTANVSRAKQLIHTDWPTYGADLIDAASDREMNWAIGLIEEIRSVRAQMHVPVGQKLPMVQVALDDAGRKAWANNATLIQRLARTDSLTEGAAPKGSVAIVVEGGSFALPLAGVIDIGAEQARLSKSLEKLDKDIAGLSGRLNNPRFIASAKEEVVDEARDNLALNAAEAAKLRTALARLAEIG